MAKETERKFLVRDDTWLALTAGARHIVQAYVALDGPASLRVRITDDARAELAIKMSNGQITRDEFEYAIPLAEARELIAASRGRLIEKIRFLVPFRGYEWEVDEYRGVLSGLVVAEVELAGERDDPPIPAWIGREVTGDGAWSNAALATSGLPEPVMREFAGGTVG
ncbi:CYTH domain-containing protein [Oricola cellulosilytica]|uniref:CYTH domain-containing protein n=1 Tax=Oricola cellulosilytica TaxID=1429082 RepID=A0A4V2MP59_9HYPH|nr:CYTH domain-containing protein [Oricola cellulosilytica]TCD16402.1 CYTH domain-containing protein [Oricola cellulosilytica]